MISFTNPHFYINIFLSLFNAVIMCFLAYKFFQTIQLSGYRVKGFFSWLSNTRGSYLSRLFMLSLLSVLSATVTNIIFQSLSKNIYLGYIGLIFYFVLAFVFIRYAVSRPDKVPLKYTHRMNRYIIAFYILSAVATFFSIDLFFKVTNIFRFCIIAITPLYAPVLTLLVHFLTLPFEELNRLKYVKRAKKVIVNCPNLKTIAITGSFGKTSTKFFLQTILSEKFSVVSTPNSFNTPMGITKTINSIVKPTHDYFIAEYGATHVGDIKYLCSIVQPDISVLLNIGTAHLATFSNKENIVKTKYEIIENIKENGLAVFNTDNSEVEQLAKKYNKNKLEVSTQNKNIYFSNVKVTTIGTSFTININGESAETNTKVLGEHNLNNILVCVFIANYLGLTINEIANGIQKIVPMKNRLQLIKSPNGITILDDSFNCNETGAICALNVLKKFRNKKVLLTPGMIELGDRQYQANFDFASYAGEICDKVIIVNKANKQALERGLLSKNFNLDNIYFYDTLLEAQLDFGTILSKGDVLLIENDLPDNYV